MGISERRKREKEELKNRIFMAAAELLVKEGYENLSVRNIAKKIDYSPTTIYLYFSNKSELVTSIIAKGYDIYLQRLNKCEETYGEDPIENLRRLLRVYIDVGIENPNLYRAIFFTELVNQFFLSEALKKGASSQAGLSNLTSAIEAGVKKGALEKCDAELVAQTLWSAVHGIVSLVVVQKDLSAQRQKALIETLLDTLINGLKKKRIK